MTNKGSTFLNVVLDNSDISFSVRSRMFVPEANRVTNLMNYDSKLVTVLPYGNSLTPISFPSNIRATSVYEINSRCLQYTLTRNTRIQSEMSLNA